MNATDVRGETPLHAALGWSQRGVVKALLAAGADLDKRDARGRTPPDAAPDQAGVLSACWQAAVVRGHGTKSVEDGIKIGIASYRGGARRNSLRVLHCLVRNPTSLAAAGVDADAIRAVDPGRLAGACMFPLFQAIARGLAVPEWGFADALESRFAAAVLGTAIQQHEQARDALSKALAATDEETQDVFSKAAEAALRHRKTWPRLIVSVTQALITVASPAGGAAAESLLLCGIVHPLCEAIVEEEDEEDDAASDVKEGEARK